MATNLYTLASKKGKEDEITYAQTPTDIFRTEYPKIDEFRDIQLKKIWFPLETRVEKDIHDIKTNLTEAERYGLFKVLKLFSKYEMQAGSDYWTGRYMDIFKRHEFQSMASVFGMFELAIHKVFYNRLNELMTVADDSFYLDYKENPNLKARIDFIDSIVDHEDDLISLAGFSFVEGAILYSSFAYLLHFQNNGKNKLHNTVAGIQMSLIDESIHFYASAYSYNLLKEEKKISSIRNKKNEDLIYEMAENMVCHEDMITKSIFEKGEIEGITEKDLLLFNRNRVDDCLAKLQIAPLFNAKESSINNWFYRSINSYIQNDFFVSKGREYTRKWDMDAFKWNNVQGGL